MRWEDERYVRVYTRDTPDWIALGWEAQALFVFILRKCDRAGILEMGKSGLRGLAALVRVPPELVERVLPILLEDGCVERHETALVVRNFVPAQETAASDAKRAREHRERARASACASPVTEREATDTNGDDASRSVTPASREPDPHHEPSRAVTLCCAVPSRTVQNQDPPEGSPAGAPGATRGTRLPEDWTPSEATVRRFQERERVDSLASLERFRNYWLGKSGRSATKVDWERTFTNWVLEDIARGRAKPLEPPPRGGPPQPAPDALAPADASAHFERLQSDLTFAGAMPWEKAG